MASDIRPILPHVSHKELVALAELLFQIPLAMKASRIEVAILLYSTLYSLLVSRTDWRKFPEAGLPILEGRRLDVPDAATFLQEQVLTLRFSALGNVRRRFFDAGWICFVVVLDAVHFDYSGNDFAKAGLLLPPAAFIILCRRLLPRSHFEELF